MTLEGIFEGEVKNLSSDGHGVVHHPEGQVFFVEGVWPGDKGRFRIEKSLGRYGYARIENLSFLSKTRRAERPCPHQGFELGKCGGCPWMIGTYASQLEFKEHRLRFALDRAGLLKEGVLKEIWPSTLEFGYRNRAQFKTNGSEIGFVSSGAHALAPIETCAVLNEKMAQHLKKMRALLPKESWKPGPGHIWNFIDIDEDSVTGEDLEINRRRPFRQGNESQNQKMRDWLWSQLQDQESLDKEVLELFCGCGNFTEILSRVGFAKIRALEISQAAIRSLKDKKLPGVEALIVDLSQPASLQRLSDQASQSEILVLDPPREGAKELPKWLKKFSALRKIFYISCDVATFVRDAKGLEKLGFALKEVQPLDLFPHTPHVEILARLEKYSIVSNT